MLLTQLVVVQLKSFAEAWHPFFNTMEFEEVRNQTDVEVILEFNRNGEGYKYDR